MPRQIRRSRRGLQGKLAKQAENSKLLRLLLASVWFRLAVVGMLLVFVALVLALVPFLDTSPREIPGVYRTSGLNMVQAWRLHQKAVATTEAKEYEEADYLGVRRCERIPGTSHWFVARWKMRWLRNPSPWSGCFIVLDMPTII